MEQGHKLVDDAIVTVKGRLDRNATRSASGSWPRTSRSSRASTPRRPAPLRLRVPATSLNELKIHQLERILREHPANRRSTCTSGTARCCAWPTSSASTSTGSVGELRGCFGHDAVML